VRRDAIAAYSERWDEVAKRRLVGLLSRADRVLGGTDRARGQLTDAWLQLFRGPAA